MSGGLLRSEEGSTAASCTRDYLMCCSACSWQLLPARWGQRRCALQRALFDSAVLCSMLEHRRRPMHVEAAHAEQSCRVAHG